jgi:hypothetical protein
MVEPARSCGFFEGIQIALSFLAQIDDAGAVA